MELKPYILNRFARDSRSYQSWMLGAPLEFEVVEDFPPTWEIPRDAGIVITHLHYRWEEMAVLRRIYETNQVPILILADGVIEYRNTWENPTVADGAMFQPLMGHKLACIGRAQVRTVGSWGNAGKCELVGLPTLDDIFATEHLPVQATGSFRLLVITANTPAFTPCQRAKTVASIRAIAQRVKECPFVNQRRIEIVWRLTDGLASESGISVDAHSPNGKRSLPEEIELADAVITTPSTAYLESVLMRRPTAVLDFTNSPAYVPSAWTISAPAHINVVLRELENPPAAKMQFQRDVLLDQVELGTGTGARGRLYELIKAMMAAGAKAQESGEPISLPATVLASPQADSGSHHPEFDARSLYPKSASFRIEEARRLRQELNLAIARLGQLPADLDRKNSHIEKLSCCLEESEVRIGKIRERVQNQAELLAQKIEVNARKTEHIETMNQMVQRANENVASLRGRLAKKNSKIESLNREVGLATATIARLQSELHQSKIEIENMAPGDSEGTDSPTRKAA